MVTPDGEAFLYMQLAPHQAEASNLFKQSNIYYGGHQAMDNRSITSNLVEFLGMFESPDISEGYSIDLS